MIIIIVLELRLYSILVLRYELNANILVFKIELLHVCIHICFIEVGFYFVVFLNDFNSSFSFF